MARTFSLEALPARKGDSLIIHFGAADAPGLVVVDGGPSRVYEESLRPRLETLRAERAPGPDGRRDRSLGVDLLMVSHVDDDHIHGVLDLADEVERDTAMHAPPLVRVDTLWHNSFDNIIGNAPQMPGPLAEVLASFGETAIPENADSDTAMVLASIRQGYNLRNLAAALGWNVNAPFPEVVENSGADAAPVTRFGGGLTITVLGPRRAQLLKLQQDYDDFLREHGLGREAPEAALAALSQDKSVANLSSLVLLLELDGKRMLLTGDALGDDILAALEERGLASEAAPFRVDLLKMQHHGSNRNATPDFFRRIKASHYVFSGDGEHGNPERETLEWLFAAQGDAPVALYFTYPIAEIDAGRKREAEKQHKAWTPESDALETLFAQERAAGRAFTVTVPDDRTGVRIDLLPETGG